MKAISVNASSRQLEVLDIPAPGSPPPGHVVVDIEACGINHGDKTFLAMPGAAGATLNGLNRVWGVSAAGKVRAIGADVPRDFLGKPVAIYRSLSASEQTIGLWSEQAQVLASSCVILPEEVSPRDYCGSLVNVITPYAFLEQIAADGHHGVIATAGTSATALALAVLAKQRQVLVIHLVRSQDDLMKAQGLGIEHVLSTNEEGFESSLGQLAEKLGATAVFDGLGGALTGRIAPHVPTNTAIYLYGLLDASVPIAIPTRLFMSKNLVVKRFSNFNSPTVKDPERLVAAIAALRGVMGDPLFRTKIGKAFRFEEIDEAMRYQDASGGRAILVPPAIPLEDMFASETVAQHAKGDYLFKDISPL